MYKPNEHKLLEIAKIEEKIGAELPKSYTGFLLGETTNIYKYKNFSRKLRDGYKTIIQIEEVMTAENFLENNKYLNFIVEFQEQDDLSTSYVEGKYLFQIMDCNSKGVYLAMRGAHKGKIYIVDNGDYGITFQDKSLEDFLESIFDLEEMECTVEQIDSSIRNSDLEALIELLENKRGRMIFSHSSYHDRYFFKLAYETKAEDILKYFLSNDIYGFDEAKNLNLIN